jgi:predicted metal-dependent peptidase
MPGISLTRTESRKLQSCHVLLLRRQAYLAAALLELGKVHFAGDCATAAILASGRRVTLLFNRDYFAGLRLTELAAVLIHETLHFVFAHLKRLPSLRKQHERNLFSLACEAVINDLISAGFPHLPLPGNPVTGPWLVGRNTAGMTADEVMFLLKLRLKSMKFAGLRILSSEPLDEHSRWETDDLAGTDSNEPGVPPARWDQDTSRLAEELLRNYGHLGAFGSMPLGQDRSTGAGRQLAAMDLAQFLLTTIQQTAASQFDWTRPNRRLMALYPRLILPSDKPRDHWSVLMALDASGSIPDQFLRAARAVASRPLPNTTVELVSFDTRVYPVDPKSNSVKGGGGTSAQAVEEYACRKRRYPDMVIVFTDGEFARPALKEPERWLWILPPWGAAESIPLRGRIVGLKGLPGRNNAGAGRRQASSPASFSQARLPGKGTWHA